MPAIPQYFGPTHQDFQIIYRRGTQSPDRGNVCALEATAWDLQKKLKFDESLYQKVSKNNKKRIGFHYLKPADYGLEKAESTDWSSFSEFTEAYYTFLHELTDIQVASTQLVLKEAPVSRLFVDGGFNANFIFLEMLRKKLPDLEIIPSDFPNGSALGAAMLVNMDAQD